jgi:CENP-B N-terminal DNA-binding domain
MFPKLYPRRMKTAPGESSEGRLAWSRPFFSSPRTGLVEHIVTDAQDDADVTNGRSLVVSSVPQRRRITAGLRVDVIEHYNGGMSSREVALKLGLGRTTVLDILKAAGVALRPRGRRC